MIGLLKGTLVNHIHVVIPTSANILLYKYNELFLFQVTEIFQRSLNCLVKLHHRLKPEVPLCPGAAVVVMCAGQCHTHGREGRLDGHQWRQQLAHQAEQQSDEVDQPVREVATEGRVAEPGHYAGDEVPEWQGCVICDEN